MKFVSLNRKNREVLHIAAPSKGMDLSKPTVHLTEGMTGICKNMIFDGGVLKTRKGLSADLNNILDMDVMDSAYNYEFFTTKTEVFHNGENKRIAAAKVEYDYSHYFILVYLIGEKGDHEYIGYMHFMRVDDSTFYVPKNVVFYSGIPQAGGGIFAFVTSENVESGLETEYAVYEINENWNEWERAYNYYTPTVYINGRGDSYEQARADNQVSGFTPKVLEAQNMLYNRFYAYFTSDGYSSSFRLPFTELSNTSVICRVHTSPTEYTEWVVYPNKTEATQSFKGGSVAFNIDRKTGMFYFTSNGTNYSMPVMENYRENNIRIAAQMDYDTSYASVVSCTVSATLGSSILFSGGIEKNRIYYTSFENPLYFPKLEENEIGSADECVETFYRYGDTVYAFKDNKIYSLKLESAKAINKAALLADNGKTFYEKLNFKITCISDKIGSVRSDTVSVINGKLIWQGKDSKVYICESGGNTYCISDEVEPILKECSSEIRSVASVFDSKYMLCFANKALVFDFTDKNTNISKISRYYWVFPIEEVFSGCMNIGGNPIFLCRKPNESLCYTATLCGTEDIIILNSSQKEKRKIPCFVKFKSYYLDDGSYKKNIHTLFLQLSLSGKTKIKIGEGVNSEEFSLRRKGFSTGGYDSVKLLPDLFGVDLVEISIDSEDCFAFSSAEIYYTKTVF